MANIMDILKRAMMGEDELVKPPLADPNALQDAQSDAEMTQINDEAKSPNLKTKPELAQDQVKQAAQKTVPGQLQDQKVGAGVQNPEKAAAEALVSPQDKLRQSIAAYEKKMNAPQEDPGINLADALAGAHNIINYGQNRKLPMLKTDNAAKLKAKAVKERSGKLDELQKLQGMYRQLKVGQDKGKITEFQKAQLAGSEKDRALKEKLGLLKAATAKAKGDKPTKGDEAIDKKFAKKYVDWNTGGKADYEVNSKIFREAIADLKSKDTDTGFLSGLGSELPGVRTDTRETEDKVRKAINGMLRATLGSQFTEKEGERIFRQTFDPYASEESNVERMNMELAKLEKRKDAMVDMSTHYSKNRTMTGYEGAPVEAGQTDAQGSEVKRRTKDGKVAVFNAETKEFIRYED